MHQNIISIATGLVAGVIGSLIISARTPQAPLPPPTSPPPEEHGAIVPPGWDPQYVGRLAQVERGLAALQKDGTEKARGEKDEAAAAARAPANDAERAAERAVAEREAGRLEHYKLELDTRETQLIDHQEEPRDASWAATAEENLKSAFLPSERTGKASVRSAECRSKTCVVELEFPTPTDGLSYVQSGKVPPVPGTRGMTATPTPPTGPGVYTLTLLYNR